MNKQEKMQHLKQIQNLLKHFLRDHDLSKEHIDVVESVMKSLREIEK